MIISEDYMIKAVLSYSEIPLSSGEISKKIFDNFDYRITKTTVKNYLWSSLRNLVECNTENWVYSLKKDSSFLSINNPFKVVVQKNLRNPDFLSTQTVGDKVICTYLEDLQINEIIKALIELELANELKKDALKKLNFRIKINRIEDDIE